ncbi:MAG: TIGR02147 family protein [Chitinivibrionales bacterium]|nr:TIGR02147 family protein [Chitinivibrionales bacterium]
MIDIYTYIDFRKLLKDLYEEHKKKHPFFSYRYIAQKVGFSSAGFFTNIIQGKRNISSEYIFKFAQLFKFNKGETEYFELLVNFGQAKSHSQKKYYFEKILANKKSKITITDAQHYEFYNKWYYTAIRELIDIFPVKANYDELAKMVHPPIKPAEAKKAVEFLEAIDFIKRNADGYFEQTDNFISTGYEAKSVAITNFLISMIDLARFNIERLPREKRSMSTLTFSISEDGYNAIIERLKNIHREILEMVREDRSHNKQDRIYHVNVQVFPLSKVE